MTEFVSNDQNSVARNIDNLQPTITYDELNDSPTWSFDASTSFDTCPSTSDFSMGNDDS